MKVLFGVWECAPFLKVGGLGDVARSLPRALSEMGVDIRLVMPYYKAIKTGYQKKKYIGEISVDYAGKSVRLKIYSIMFKDADVTVYLISNRKYMDRPMEDTWGVFDLVVSKIAMEGIEGWNCDVVHCNDHHLAYVPLLLKKAKSKVKTLLTIHSLLHQRRISEKDVAKMGISPSDCRIMNWEVPKKRVVSLLEGIRHADLVNTVSEAYATEIREEEFGAGLDDELSLMPDKIRGIQNGIDENDWPINIKDDDFEIKKKIAKEELQEKLGFEVNRQIPLISYVGRLDAYQKGIDLIHKMLLRINLQKYQFVILGDGNKDWEERFNLVAKFYPDNIYRYEKYKHEHASEVYRASDIVLMPSRYEPCGLIYMIAMRNAAIMVARSVGGIKDSVEDGVTGFLFDKYSSHELQKALEKAVGVYKNDKNKWRQMQKECMKKDFSWKASAQKYIDLYKQMLGEN